MNKIIFFVSLLLTYFSTFAQQQQSSTVQLPDFVITGKDVVNVQKAKSIPPDFIPIVSEQFIKPVFPTESLPIKEVQTPIKGSLDSIDSLNFSYGRLDAGMGFYSLPSADLTFANPFKNGLLEAFFNGFSQRAYVSQSDQYKLNGGANLFLFVNNNSNFLPGTKVSFHGDYKTTGYKLFASDNPFFKRNYNRGIAYVGIDNNLGKNFIFNAKATDESANYKNENFTENLFDLSGAFKLSLPYFNVSSDIDYKKQFITNDLNNNSKFSYLALRPSIGVEFSKVFKASFGFNYDKIDTDFSFSPYLGIGVNIDQGISLYAEYSPNANFLEATHFADINPYFRAQKFSNIFMKENSEFNVAMKYEYFTYFEIDGGIKYKSSDNYPYFTDAAEKGIFDVRTTSANNFTAYINLLFHRGPYGYFYATGEFSDTRDSAGFLLPYYPKVKASLNYGYNFVDGFNAEINLNYNGGVYSDLQNTNYIKNYINLGLKLSYSIQSNLDLTAQLQNITNNKNYFWKGYQELPFDLTGGIKLRF
jgi:hypothetical protein